MNVASSTIELPTNALAYLAEPKAEGNFPAVIVIHEVFGLVKHIKDVAERFAREGYVALAIDLFNGKSAGTVEEGRKLRALVTEEKLLAHVAAGIQYLTNHRSSTGRIGIIGFCMGGGFVLLAACRLKGLSACTVFYGKIDDANLVANLDCPVLGIFGEADDAITPWAVNDFKNAMQVHGKQLELRVYPGAPHAFFNDTRLERYRSDAARDAWQKTLAFFRRTLGNGRNR